MRRILGAFARFHPLGCRVGPEGIRLRVDLSIPDFPQVEDALDFTLALRELVVRAAREP